MTRLGGVALSALLLAGCATAPAPDSLVVPPPPEPVAAAQAKEREVPGGMQWLYGSAEGASASIQTFRAFERYVAAAVRNRPRDSAVLQDGANPASPAFVPCGNKPFAVVLDADETAVQNQGLEYALAARGVSSDRPVMNAWQNAPQTAAPAMPGAVEALRNIRALGVTVIFNTNRDSPTAAATSATLNAAGVGPAEHLKTMFLRGDVDGKSGKDGRRLHVALRYCVIAMAGDQMGDFSDLLNAQELAPRSRRQLASTGRIGALWGNGWFLLSNPVYGPGLRGGLDEVFTPENRWQPANMVETK
jgi:predicted secreted acid phosphatase